MGKFVRFYVQIQWMAFDVLQYVEVIALIETAVKDLGNIGMIQTGREFHFPGEPVLSFL